MNERRNCHANAQPRLSSREAMTNGTRSRMSEQKPRSDTLCARRLSSFVVLNSLSRFGVRVCRTHRTQIEELAALTAKGAAGGPRRAKFDEYKRSLQLSRRERARAREADELCAAKEMGLKRPPKPLTAGERQRAIDRKRMRDVFDDFDADGSGTCDHTEFGALLDLLGMVDHELRAASASAARTPDNADAVAEADAPAAEHDADLDAGARDARCTRPQPLCCDAHPSSRAAAYAPVDEEQDERRREVKARIIREVDKDNSGAVDFEEFFAYFFGASGAATSSDRADRDALLPEAEAGKARMAKAPISFYDMASGKLHTQQAMWAFKEDALLSAQLNELRRFRNERPPDVDVLDEDREWLVHHGLSELTRGTNDEIIRTLETAQAAARERITSALARLEQAEARSSAGTGTKLVSMLGGRKKQVPIAPGLEGEAAAQLTAEQLAAVSDAKAKANREMVLRLRTPSGARLLTMVTHRVRARRTAERLCAQLSKEDGQALLLAAYGGRAEVLAIPDVQAQVVGDVSRESLGEREREHNQQQKRLRKARAAFATCVGCGGVRPRGRLALLSLVCSCVRVAWQVRCSG